MRPKARQDPGVGIAGPANLSCGSNMIALAFTSVLAAVGYSLIYLFGGGELVGAIFIFVIVKMMGK